VGASPAAFDYQKLEWMNGVYLRAMTPDAFAYALSEYLGEGWDNEKVRQIAPLVQEKIATLGEFPAYAAFFFTDEVNADPKLLNPTVLRAALRQLESLDAWTESAVEAALRQLADELGLKPREAFQPIRVAVTGSTVSPGLFESLALLGREKTLARIRAAIGES